MLKRSLSIIGLAIGLTIASGAQAAQTLDLTSFTYKHPVEADVNGHSDDSEEVSIGGFNALLGTQAFLSFSVDAEQSFKFGHAFSVKSVDANVFYSAPKALAIGQLYTQHFASIDDAKDSAAFQLALWEIVNETSSTFSLANGVFKASTESSAAKIANKWLRGLSGTGDAYRLTVLTNSKYQDQLMAMPVPESESYAMMLAGFGLLGVVSLRRKAENI
jgi:hypothetical protein